MTRPRCVGGHRRMAIDEGWQIAAAPCGSTFEDIGGLGWLPAEVPGTAAGALRAAGKWDFSQSRIFDAEDFWWRVRIIGTPGPAVLGFDGLATLAEVWLDGEPILESENMFVAHEVPIRLTGEHELVIRCRALAPELAIKRPRPRWRVPMIEQQQLRWIRTTLLGRTPGWSPPCPPVGPWRPVWIEQHPLRIDTVTLDARVDLTAAIGTIDISAGLDECVEQATLIVERDGQRNATPLMPQEGCWRARAAIASPALWWPHTHGVPVLYRVSLELRHDGDISVVDLGATGFRSLDVDHGEGDDFRVCVNGVPIFCRGACWTPLDVVTLGATPEAYRDAVAQVRDAGMNMLRVGGTMVYEDDAFYDALDEYGILLWQDFMFANMDYPEDEAFSTNVLTEVEQQLARLQARPCLAILCGNSEGEQQAAMSSAGRERWSPSLFHELIADRVRSAGVSYTPSSTHGGAFPHAANAGPASYYGVGAYLRPLDDARRAEVRFASECLAFANIPEDSGLPAAGALRVHHPAWKARSPRDLGAGWDFDDVRDHYVQRLYNVDPALLRVSDHERYLALGRAATGEVMARTFAEWRRARSPTRGALIWFLRDLWPGAGWGVVDANGVPKSCFHALRRALAPIALAITDEGANGLGVHLFNDPAQTLDARIEINLYRAGEIQVGHGAIDVTVPGHGAAEFAAANFFDGFLDLSYAYRFGPPLADVVHAKLLVGNRQLADTFWFPVGLPATRELDVGLAATSIAGTSSSDRIVTVSSRRFAQSVMLDVPGFIAEDTGFHLAPGQSRIVALRATEARRDGRTSGVLTALNAESGARFEVS